MDRVKSHFQDEARVFDGLIIHVIPYYRQMIEALISAIPHDRDAPLRAIDLGCGTATIAKMILERFPRSSVTCLDFSENMLKVARAKLDGFENVRFVFSDFNSHEFDQEYDVAVSSLALHHLVACKDKRQYYRKIFDSLRPGGVFFNADVVLASSDHLQDVYMHRWREYMLRAVPEHEVFGKWMTVYETEDRPSKLVDQLIWLAEIGFDEVDVVWKYFNFAVYGGRKPRSSN